jgi:hypothetical protein
MWIQRCHTSTFSVSLPFVLIIVSFIHLWVSIQREKVQSVPKHNPKTNTYYGTKVKPEAGLPHVIDTPDLPRNTESRSAWLLGRCSRQLRQSCAGANMVYSRAERVFILEHYFSSTSFAAVREAFSNAYPDKEVPNKTTIHRLVATFRVDFCLREGGGNF